MRSRVAQGLDLGMGRRVSAGDGRIEALAHDRSVEHNDRADWYLSHLPRALRQF
jgi:hypothetical protein